MTSLAKKVDEHTRLLSQAIEVTVVDLTLT